MEIERIHTFRGRFAASVASLPDSTYCALMSATGAGTTNDPLRIALLERVVSWGDEETAPEVARNATKRVHSAMQDALVVSGNAALVVADALRAADEVAISVGDCFSACAAIVADTQVVIAAIGYVRAWLLRGGVYHVLIEPHIRPQNPRPGGAVGLLASLGIGYSLDKRRLAEVHMEPDDVLLLTVSGEFEERPALDSSETITPEALLHRTKPVGMQPAIVVVIGGNLNGSSHEKGEAASSRD